MTAIEFRCPPLAIGRGDRPALTIDNCAVVIGAIHEQGGRIRHDAFLGRIVCEGLRDFLGLPDGGWTDEHTSALARKFELLRLEVSPNAVDRAVALHAKQHEFNSLTDFVAECAERWDKTPRVDAAFTTYWGAEDTPATRIASRVLMLSLAARALMPGCKADVCVTLVGAQGGLKSSSLEALVGKDRFRDSPLGIGEKDGMQELRGNWLRELGENAPARKDQNEVKRYLSSAVDTYRPSHGRHVVEVPRQVVFVNTANPDGAGLLFDTTGHRRFPIVEVGTIDLAGIARDREQLIGEAASRVLDGELNHPDPRKRPRELRWWADYEDDQILNVVRSEYEEPDPWEETIISWLENRSPGTESALRHKQPGEKGWKSALERARALRDVLPFTLAELFDDGDGKREKATGAIPIAPKDRGKREQGRAARILHGLGFRSYRAKSGPNRDKKLWALGTAAGAASGGGVCPTSEGSNGLTSDPGHKGTAHHT